MKKLIGIIETQGKEKFLFQENSHLLLKDAEDFVKPPNYELLKNRNIIIGNGPVYGDSVFNFRYGPVTGGVQEAGVYNIYTSGEKILGVDIDVTFKKRNIEKKIIGKSPFMGIKFAESVCGNFAFSHSLSYSRAIEKICEIEVTERTKLLRVIALELERIYNHFYVITELAKGASLKVFTSHMQYLFEEILRLNSKFSGSRHLKNFNKIGEIDKFDETIFNAFLKKIDEIYKRFEYIYSKSLESGNYLDRLHNTGVITSEYAQKIGLTGPSLRATGIKEDLRENDVYYDFIDIPIKLEGDALARMEVRAEEVFISFDIIKKAIEKLKKIKSKILKKDIELYDGKGFFGVEGPSGTVCYYIEIKNGVINYCYISTSSIHGFKAIADSLVGQIFTDFVFTVESFGVNFADACR